jgi:hypothetical protein
MQDLAQELLRVARDIVSASTPFKDIPVGGVFHHGISKGIGYTSDEFKVTFYEKMDKSKAKVVKSDWAPRQMGVTYTFHPFDRVFPVENVPQHDTRQGL